MSRSTSRVPRGRGARLGNLNPVFQRQTPDLEAKQLSTLMIKQARRSGKLVMKSMNLTTVPERVWQLDSLDEVELGLLDMSLDNGSTVRGEANQKWWEHEPLQLLDLSNNAIVTISPRIKFLGSLTTLLLQNNSLEGLPEEVGLLTKLTQLNLSHNHLEFFPECIFKLTELRHLNISHNKIAAISESIGDLIMLEKLDMSHNSLTVLPPGVGFLTRLNQLQAQHNSIADVPPDVGNLRVLRELDLSNNAIPLLPPLGELRKLEVFRADHNALTAMTDMRGCLALREVHLGTNCIEEIAPELLEDLANLRVLSLKENKLEILPQEITNLRNLIRLDISNNGLKELPSYLALLPHLSTLLAEGNPLKGIRMDILRTGTSRVLKVLRGKLTDEEKKTCKGSETRSSSALPGGPQPWPTKYTMRGSKALSLAGRHLEAIPDEPFKEAVAAEVTCVDLSKNVLSAVPDGVMLLIDFMSELNLSTNKLTSVPGSLAKIRNLQYVNFAQNCLSDLPQELNSMERLREINIAQNRFTKVPECVHGLPGLEIIIARDNKITAIDAAGLGTIPRLASLDLANNDIAVVPPQLGLLKLYHLELSGNAFRNPRHAILEKGTDTLMSYLRDRIPK